MTTSSHKEDRVKKATPSSINEKIERDTWQKVATYTAKSPDVVSAKIKELESN